MKSNVQVAVIGGGVVGCSVLYHLTKRGWKDVVLLERDELTSGSTWHAAGGMHTLNGDPNVAKLQQYTIELYKEIQEISGQDCSIHITGGVALADTPERMDWLRMAHARGRYLGMHTELITPSEAKTLMPLIDEKFFVGAMWDEVDGHIAPADVTNAYAKAARLQGAEVYRHTRVTDLTQREDGSWDVITEQGNIHAEHVVNAGGLWAREVGRMVGLELPILAMEHQYLITEDMPEVMAINESTGKEVLHAIDFGGELYLRQERKGMLMGTYERAGKPWSPRVTPWDFGHELLSPDLDRIAPSLEVGFEHFPAFQTAGIKQIINGPFTFAPDGNPLIGPIRGLRNYWVACGVMAGFSQGGGVGLALSNWIIDGEPGFDVWRMDVARYGDWATMAYTNAKVRENYSRRFRITFPNEELAAARPLRTTPIYDLLKSHNAVFGVAYGLEHALWYAPAGSEPKEDVTFRRSNAFPHVREEVKTVRERVGMMEISTFAKYEVTGAGAEAWLSGLLACRMPRTGRMTLAPMLDTRGKLIGDFTLARLADERFFILGSGLAEKYHMRWFLSRLPGSGVRVHAWGADLTGLALSGPRSRELLQSLADTDLANAAFPFMSIREMDLGMVPALVGRVSFTGELGYEIWVKPAYQRHLFQSLMEHGKPLGLGLYGSRALNSLRIEKSFGSWATEYRPIYGPAEAGLDRFVALSKNDFVGREQAAAERDAGPKRRLCTFVLETDDADVIGDEPIWLGDEVVGWVTSGGYAHWSQQSVALGYVAADKLATARPDDFHIELIGVKRKATLQGQPIHDPAGARMRS